MTEPLRFLAEFRERLNAVRVEPFRLRRAAGFAVNTALPMLLGVVAEVPAGALLGGITGLLFSFADDAGPLSSRFRILALVAIGLLGGGGAGFFLRGHPPAFWILFVGLTLAAGWLNRIGRGEHLAARFAAIALAVVSGMPTITPRDGLFVLFACAVAALSRLADHLCFGPWPASATPPRPPVMSARAWSRFALAYAATATLAVRIGVVLDPGRAIWVAIPGLVLMQPEVRSNYRRAVENILGTLLGIVAAWAITQAVSSEPILVVGALMTAALIPHHLPHRFWLHTALVALYVMLVYDLATTNAAAVRALLAERVLDVLLGCALALAATVLVHAGDRAENGSGS